MGQRRTLEDVRPFSLIPFGALIRVKGTDQTGTVTGYLIHRSGPMEYEVRLHEGRVFVPVHRAVPITRRASRGRGKVKVSRSERAAAEAAEGSSS